MGAAPALRRVKSAVAAVAAAAELVEDCGGVGRISDIVVCHGLPSFPRRNGRRSGVVFFLFTVTIIGAAAQIVNGLTAYIITKI